MSEGWNLPLDTWSPAWRLLSPWGSHATGDVGPGTGLRGLSLSPSSAPGLGGPFTPTPDSVLSPETDVLHQLCAPTPRPVMTGQAQVPGGWYLLLGLAKQRPGLGEPLSPLLLAPSTEFYTQSSWSGNPPQPHPADLTRPQLPACGLFLNVPGSSLRPEAD